MTRGQPSHFLLSHLSPVTRASLLKRATPVELPIRTVLYEEHSVPRYGYFLLSGLASVVTVMPDAKSAEVCFIGREGLVGSLHLLGPASLSTRCVMQFTGSAFRVPFRDLQEAFHDCQEVRSGILEFAQMQAAMCAYVAGCNRLHTTEQRLVRWLLMAQDLTGFDELDFTQDYLSQMMATQRTTVTLIAGSLQRRGLIRYSRGKIHVLNRTMLETAACMCYPAIKGLLVGLYRGGGPPGLAARVGPPAVERPRSLTA